jgi:hypothetical protein
MTDPLSHEFAVNKRTDSQKPGLPNFCAAYLSSQKYFTPPPAQASLSVKPLRYPFT